MVEVVSILMVVVGAGLGALVVWSIMAQRSARLVESAKSNSAAEVAAAEAREGALSLAKSDMRKQMQDAFELAATEAFKTAVKSADDEKETSFSVATQALSESMTDYMKAIQESEKADIKRAAELSKEVGSVSELGLQLAQETRELALALKGDSQAQGAWGEVVVENLLQSMGFVEGRDYVKQLSETAEDGTRKRTDFVLNLPDNRQIVIDSKVSLTAYTEYVNAEDEATKETALKAHCTSIRGHAKELASKNYEHLEGIHTLDFVLMVVPLESAFIDAMRADQSLYDDLVGNRRVKVVSGTSFMLTLILIQELWKRENQSRNQMELLKRAGSLHDKVTLFLESFTEVGFELGQARSAYDRARTRLTDGPGNVIRQTEQMAELGAKVKKDLREKSGVRKLAEEAELNEVRADSRTEMVVVEAEEEE
jgi:DNA recombination protein RmuC